MRVGFIGLGNQGGPMATRIAGAGHDLTVWARRAEVLEAYPTATRAATPAELAAAVDVACVCVVNDADVAAVCLAPDGLVAHLRHGSALLVHSTVHPDTVLTVAAAAAEHGIDVLDAPVSGGNASAANGTLLTIVGGDAAVLDRCRPVLTAHSSTVAHVGGVGAAQRAKLINNALFASSVALAFAALDLGTTLGVDRASLAEVIRNGSARSFAAEAALQASSIPGGAERMSTLLGKDIGILGDLAGDDPDADMLLVAPRRLFGPQ